MATAVKLQGPCPTCGRLGKSLESKMRRTASDVIGKFLNQTYFEQIALAQKAENPAASNAAYLLFRRSNGDMLVRVFTSQW